MNNDKVENNDKHNSDTQEKDHSKSKSNIEISKSVTKHSPTNLTGSTTSTTENLPNEK